MNSAIIDNAIGADITRCITWQFDKATRLVGIITALKDFYDQSTGELWDRMIDSVENIDEADDYGLSVWGKILNVRRPIFKHDVEARDENVYYCKYTGALSKVNSSHTESGSDVGFYFSNENFILVPFQTTYGNEYDLWKANEESYNTMNCVAFVEDLTSFSIDPIPFTEFRINEEWIPSAQIDGGCAMGHNYITEKNDALSKELYRKILKGRFALMNGNAELGIVGNASMSDYVKYVNYVFDGKVSVAEGPSYSTPEAMSMTFADNGLGGELLDLFTNHKDVAFLYPCGIHDNSRSSSLRFGLDPSHTTHRSDRGGLGESSFTWN